MLSPPGGAACRGEGCGQLVVWCLRSLRWAHRPQGRNHRRSSLSGERCTCGRQRPEAIVYHSDTAVGREGIPLLDQ